MSLVIAARDKSVGIAVCEGRAVAYVNGSKVPVCENASKLSRLADGSILALTGGFRDGYETTTMRGESATEPLRRDIHAAAETRTFPALCAVVPEMLKKYRAEYPELGFAVSLLGNDGGTVRLVSWSSGKDEIEFREDGDADITSNVIGLSKDANKEASREVRDFFIAARRNYLHVNDTLAAFSKIIEDLANRHVELNGRISFEAIVASEAEREVYDFTRMLACTDGTFVTTAAKVSTAKVKLTGVSIGTPTQGSHVAITGFSWVVDARDANDVYTINGALNIADQAQGIYEVNIFVDSNTSTDYGLGILLSQTQALAPFCGSVTGLSAGSHTIQVYVTLTGGGSNGAGVGNAIGICQRFTTGG